MPTSLENIQLKQTFIRKDGSKFSAKIKITPNFGDGKNNPQTGYCGITEVIDEDVNIKINWGTKIIKGVAITRVGFASASLFPVFAMWIVIMQELEIVYLVLLSLIINYFWYTYFFIYFLTYIMTTLMCLMEPTKQILSILMLA